MSASDLENVGDRGTDMDYVLAAERAFIDARLRQLGFTDEMYHIRELYAILDPLKVNNALYELLRCVTHPVAKYGLDFRN